MLIPNGIYRSYRAALKSPRGKKKQELLHGVMAETLAAALGSDYTISSLGYKQSKELSVDGQYGRKNCDITIQHGDDTVGVIELKFIVGNYSQNSNNYFEGLLGQTTNLQRAGIPVHQLVIFLDKIPHRNKAGETLHHESLHDTHFDRYRMLIEEGFGRPECPASLALSIVKLSGRACVDAREDYYQSLSPENASFLSDHGSIPLFLEGVASKIRERHG